jgi:hypothetical protein
MAEPEICGAAEFDGGASPVWWGGLPWWEKIRELSRLSWRRALLERLE